jgi:hypothetical protein
VGIFAFTFSARCKKTVIYPCFLRSAGEKPAFQANIYASFNGNLLTFFPESGKVMTPLEMQLSTLGNARQEDSVYGPKFNKKRKI